MTQEARQKKSYPSASWSRSWDRYRSAIILTALTLSLLIHFGSFKTLGRFQGDHRPHNLGQNRSPIKIKVVDRSKTPKTTPRDQKDAKKIVEVQQTPTMPPTKDSFLGQVDHKAEKMQRLPEKLSKDKGKDAGPQGKPIQKQQKIAETTKPRTQSPPKAAEPPTLSPRVKSDFGDFKISKKTQKPRNIYESLLPSQATDLPGQVNAGYQDHITEDIPIGDRIDLNTSEYRYIGYFTAMRKAIELVWAYPQEASRRGLQGEVSLEFAIGKDGRTSHIRVVKSSGYEVLDRAIVDAIRLASPFAPLPNGFGKNKLVITGSFRYILGPYSAH